MSIVVLGMEMPAACVDCELYHNGGEYGGYGSCEAHWVIFGKEDDWVYETRPNWCPLRPLPEEHGDLIDRDATRGSIKPWSPEDERNACTFDTVKKLLNTMLDHAPTIVEAEGERDEL